FVLLLFDQLADRPAPAILLDVHDRFVYPQFVNRQIARDQLIQVVTESNVLGGYHRLPIESNRDPFQFETAKQVAAQAVNGDRAVEVLAGLCNDIHTNAVLEPGCLRNDRGSGGRSNEQDENDQQDVQQTSCGVHVPGTCKVETGSEQLEGL